MRSTSYIYLCFFFGSGVGGGSLLFPRFHFLFSSRSPVPFCFRSVHILDPLRSSVSLVFHSFGTTLRRCFSFVSMPFAVNRVTPSSSLPYHFPGFLALVFPVPLLLLAHIAELDILLWALDADELVICSLPLSSYNVPSTMRFGKRWSPICSW